MNLFVYGTLLFPEIRELVGGRIFEFHPAVLHGYKIRRVNDATFPAIVKTSNPTSQVNGEVLFDVSRSELALFDAYEDSFYLRDEVQVSLTKENEGSTVLKTSVYHVPEKLADQLLSDDQWLRSWFNTHHRSTFYQRLLSLRH